MTQKELGQQSYTESSAGWRALVLKAVSTFSYGLAGFWRIFQSNAKQVTATCHAPISSTESGSNSLGEYACVVSIGKSEGPQAWIGWPIIFFSLGTALLFLALALERIDRNEKAALANRERDLASRERDRAAERAEQAARRARIQARFLVALGQNKLSDTPETQKQLSDVIAYLREYGDLP